MSPPSVDSGIVREFYGIDDVTTIAGRELSEEGRGHEASRARSKQYANAAKTFAHNPPARGTPTLMDNADPGSG